MDAPSHGRARRTAGSLAAALVAVLVAELLAVSAPSPGAAAERLSTGDDATAQATFAVIPQRCYTDAGEVRPGPCHIEQFGTDRPTVIVWGDSHAAQQIPPLQAQARRTRTNLIAFTMGLCPPMTVERSDPDPCSRNAYRTLRFIEDKAAQARSPLTVVLGGFWRFYRTTRTGDGSERAATTGCSSGWGGSAGSTASASRPSGRHRGSLPAPAARCRREAARVGRWSRARGP
jgi:hypothetical protein